MIHLLYFQGKKRRKITHSSVQLLTKKNVILIILACVCLCLLCVSMFPCAIYASNENAEITEDTESAVNTRIVRVGYYQARDFQEGTEESAYKSGYGYEYLQRIASYTGWKYEYVYGTWQELYEKLVVGEIDLMAGISYEEERSHKISYPDLAMLNETFYIYKDIDDDSIKSSEIDSYAGKKIGTISNDVKMTVALEKWKKETNAQIEIVYYDSLADCAQAFNEKKIDAFASADNIVSSYTGIVPVEKIGKEPYYLCVSKEKKDVLDELNEALSVMTEQDIFDLQVLRNKYSAETSVNVFLSKQEQDWMEAHHTITVGYAENYLPYCDTAKDGSVMGLVADLVPDLLEALPGEYAVDITYRGFSSQSDMLESLKNGEVDLVFPVGDESWYAEQQDYVRTTAAVVSPIMLVYREPYNDETLTKIAVNKENLLQTSFTMETYPEAQIVANDTIEECIAAIKKGTANSTLVSALRSNYLIGDDKKLNSLTLAEDERLCFGVAFGNNALLQLLNHGMTILGDSYGLNHTYRYMDSFAVKYTITDFVRDNVWIVVTFLLAITVGAICYFVFRERNQKRLAKKEAEQNRRLAEALEGAKQAAVARMVFLRNMSHDIRTPMNAVVGFTNLAIKSESDTEKVHEYLTKILVSSNHLLGIVNDVLEISRIESGQTKLEEAPCRIDDIVAEADVIIREQAQEKRQKLIVDFSGIRNHYVVCDKLRVKEILVNLLGNSVKFTPAGGNVSLSVIQLDEETMQADPLLAAAANRGSIANTLSKIACYEFCVKDTGCGMSPEFLKKIFEPFEREFSTTASGIGGTGLGMPIVKSFVDMMGGTIDIQSKESAGTTITVRLTFQVEAEPNLQETTSMEERPQQNHFSGKRILLAEDNELNREIAAAVLEEAGFLVESAENGAEALKIIQEASENYFDAVLMDIQMPVMDGYTATQKIRQLAGKRGTIPIIAVSANAFNEDKAAALQVGMNGHLPKPIDSAKLIQTLDRLMAEK